MPELNLIELRAALERKHAGKTAAEQAAEWGGNFRSFVAGAWPIVEPATAFCGNWHIDAISEHLQGASTGEIQRLLINLPPRHGKSLLVSVFWPAWTWATKPQTRFLTASYGASLAERDAIKSRDLIRSGWYQQHWPHVQLKDDVNRTSRYENTASGYRIATSVGGEGTGEGGDIIIIDDPHKAEEALTGQGRARVIDWHDGTIGFRFNDPKTGVEVVVMQRLHEGDLTGHLLERDGWTHLCLPARYEPNHPHLWPRDPRKEESELLWPEHVTEPALVSIEATMGSFRAAGQLQQRPAALEGELLKRRWWRFYDPALLDDGNIGQLPKFQRIVASWDTAFKDKTTSDYVVGQVWGIRGADRYLLYGYRQRANLQATKDAMRAAHAWVEKRWPRVAQTILIEKSANGVEIIAELRRELPGITKVTVSTDKITRAIAASPPLEAGNVFVPGRANPNRAAGYDAPDWIANLIEEAATFPNGDHDDQVDAYSQAINWARTRSTRGGRVYVTKARIPDNLVALGLTNTHIPSYTRRTTAKHHSPRQDPLLQRRPVSDEQLATMIGIPLV